MYTFADLTDKLPFSIDVEKMQEEITLLESENWVSHYDVQLADGWTTIPLVSHDGSCDNINSQRIGQFGEYKQTSYMEKAPYIASIVNAFKCPHGRIRIMKLLPGTIIRSHRDTYEEVSDISFGQVRLHIPIKTNDKVQFTVARKNYHLPEGRLIYINFTKQHYVRNDGNEERVHLVLDLKVNDFLRSIFPTPTAFQKLEMMLHRLIIPIFVWIPLKTKGYIGRNFWRYYNDSIFQKLRHKFFPKNQ